MFQRGITNWIYNIGEKLINSFLQYKKSQN